MHNNERTQRMLMANSAMGPQQYNMMRAMPNGVPANANDLKRAAAMNNRPNGPNNPMANMQMKNQMIAAQMQRDGSQMDMNGQRPQSPGSIENAPSPNKRPRVEGGMNAGNMPGNQFNDFAAQGGNLQQQKSIEVYAQSLAQQQRLAMSNQAMPQGMNSGVQGSPMNQQGLDGQHEVYTGNQPRPGMPAGGPGQQQGNHALQDYQMQLMLLEQQNKKRLLMARQEQDSISTAPHGQPSVGPPGFAPAMSPQGSRSGPSPNPNDQMKRGTPKLNQQGLPGSPMPDAAMQQRSSPAPGGFPIDPSQMPPGMPPQFGYPQMTGQTPMMRPPSSHPGGFNPQQMTAQQMEAFQRSGGMPNGGGWRGPPQGMMQGQGQIGGPMGNPQQQRPMAPPPAPSGGEQQRPQEPSPSQSTAAPPTPSQTNKANPKKKVTKDNKVT
ncbi:hypothetical protein P154DRAFT_220332 [Amniculicola lignicola CBS 123094]|uniref:Uncharacterized protein n=1 Tax=Amniculicola lignicola CBS 123094 TaxID=1392246 RepID=A0A6A5WXR2_9PLEO|nr:hypothetical protein P154DRAFT_220332 [Amniculicola lignicola CBS 123094]